MQSRIINAIMGFIQHPRSMSQRCNHWECRNSFYQQEAAAKHFFDGGFLLGSNASLSY